MPTRLLAFVHTYPPKQHSGAEWMLHELLVAARSRGFDVRVLAARETGEWEFEGVPCHGWPKLRGVNAMVGEADVLLTHLDRTREAIAYSEKHGKPLVHLVHNHRQLDFHKVRPHEAALVIWNTEWIARMFPDWPGATTVVRPVVDPARYATTPGQRITLVNMSPTKGANVWWSLVRRMPDHLFLGVRGGYGQQVGFPAVRRVVDVAKQPRNVKLQHPVSDMRRVFSETRLLLMPSDYESWGRVGVEALASGIPVLAHPTDGLVESLGSAGIFLDRDDVDAWEAKIRELDDPDTWRHHSDLALARSAELDPTQDFDRFAAAILETVERGCAYQQPAPGTVRVASRRDGRTTPVRSRRRAGVG